MPAQKPDLALLRGEARTFVIPRQAGPANSPLYVGHMRGGAHSKPYGDTTPRYLPSSSAYNQFVPFVNIRGERGNPTLSLTAYAQHQVSLMEKLGDIGCPLDLQLHYGLCEDPKDFNGGFDFIRVMEGADITAFNEDETGALEPSDQNIVMQETPISALESYGIVPLTFAQRATTQLQNEVIKALYCDAVSCGECINPSDGDEIAFLIQKSSGGSPGLKAEVAYTQDGGSTWADTIIDTMATGEEPSDAACVAGNLVVLSEDSGSLHWAPIVDILAGTETWSEVTTGFEVGGEPRGIYAADSRTVFIVGAGGYIYQTEDPTAGVTVVDAGVATTENLTSVHGAGTNIIVAVGENNAAVLSTDGGDIWGALTGPVVGVNLNRVFARSESELWVATNGGELWWSVDQGVSWTEKSFSGSGAGVARDVVFATPTVGYFAHDTATPAGRIFRTIDGGYSWYLLPEGVGSIPANDRINSVAIPFGTVPNIRANEFIAGGLADSSTDGIAVKASGPVGT